MVLLSATALADPSSAAVKAPLKAPNAAFSASPTSGNSPLNVTFTDKSTGSPTSWKWNFGDGTNSTVENPSHIYNNKGTYHVTLTVKNAIGKDALTKYNYITVSDPLKAPIANFSAFPKTGITPLKVLFTDKSTGIHNSWKWTFGDGHTSKDKNPVHIYSQEGKYNVSLTVSNAAGNNTTTKSNYIVVNALKAPVAAFNAYPRSGYAPLKVLFIDKSTGIHNSWKWTFGDGHTSKDKSPVHRYSKAGNYTVSLTVSNAAGNNTTTMSDYIKVKSK
jgi:PKD repeat protein